MDVRTGLAVKGGTVTVSNGSSTQVVSIDPDDKISTSLSIESSASGTITNGDNNLVTGDAVYDAIAALTAADVGAVPTTRTVNSKALSSDITLNGADIALTGYSKPSSTSAVAATDTVNQAIGKLEKSIDSIPSGNFVTLDTAQTITSQKTFTSTPSVTSTFPELDLKNTNLDVTTFPTSTQYALIFARDKNNAEVGSFGIRKGTSATEFYSYIKMGSGTPNTTFGLRLEGSQAYMYGPSRTYNASNTNDVVTIGTMKANAVTIADAQTITGEKTFTENISILKAGESSTNLKNSTVTRGTVPSSDVRVGSLRFTDGSNATLGEIVSVVGSDGSSQMTINTIKNASTRADVPTTIVYPSSGNAYMTAPYRTSNITSNDVLTAGNGVTLGTNQTITGSKTFNIINSKDSTHNVADTRSNDEWTWTGLELFDAARRTGYLRQYYTPSNNTVTDIRSEDANSGAGIQIFSSGYVTAPTRAYNSANTNDVVTIGVMKTNAVTIADAQIITGLKTIKRGYENKLGICDTRIDQTNTSQSESWSSVLFTDVNDVKTHQISSYAKNAERRLRFYNFKSNGTTALAELDLVSDISNNTSWVTAPSRTYNSANTDDVVTIGSLEGRGYVQGPSSATANRIATFNGTTGKIIKDSGYTIATSVPANAVFTDTKVTQTYATGNWDLPIVLGNHVASNTDNYTETVYHASNMYANPSTGTITATKFVGALQGNVTGSCSGSAGNVTWNNVTGKPGFVNNGTTSSVSPNDADTNGFWYVTSNTSGVKGSNSNPFLHRHTGNQDFRILTTAYNTSWLQQIATDFRCSQMFVRYYAQTDASWSDWKAIAGGWEQRFSGAKSSGDINVTSIRGYSDCMIIARNTSNTNLGNSAVIVPISQFYGGSESDSNNWSNGLHPSSSESGSWFKSIMISTDDGTSTSYLIAIRLTSWTKFTIHDNWHSEIVGIWVR